MPHHNATHPKHRRGIEKAKGGMEWKVTDTWVMRWDSENGWESDGVDASDDGAISATTMPTHHAHGMDGMVVVVVGR